MQADRMSADGREGGAALQAKQIRPGVTLPDWSVVTSDQARKALAGIFEVFSLDNCWDDFSTAEESIWRAVLESFVKVGRPPTITELSETATRPTEEVSVLLESLQRRDLVVFEPKTSLIAGAYPLTARPTEHRVHLGSHVVHAMCAIDALGVGRMYDRDVMIESSCRANGTPIRIATAHNGTTLRLVAPSTAVVWSGTQPTEGCAADTLCTVIAFFESGETLETWRNLEIPDMPGYELSVEEAMQVGMALFGPMLRPSAS